MTVKIIILNYLVNWSKEFREGGGRNAYNWNGIFLFLLTCFGYYFLGVFLHGLLLKVVLAVASVDGREVRALPR